MKMVMKYGFKHLEEMVMILVDQDENGNEQWSQNYGGSYNEIGYSVQQTTDGGYIIT